MFIRLYTYRLQKSTMAHTLLQEFLLLLSLIASTAAASQNCSNTFALSPGSSCDCVTSSADELNGCQSLSELLVAYNGIISEGDCLELNLEPGVYTLTSYTTSVNYSTIITAPSGEVNITCQSQCSGAVNETVASGSPLAFHKNGTSRSSFVTLEGITFQDCPLPLQFDDLDSATITDCTFR